MDAITPSQYILDASRDYSIYVAQTRSIPHVADGLKHVQRVALWIMRARSEKMKTVALGGLCAYEKLYVHGDQSCNNAISLLAAPYCNNVPLLEGHGSFGSRIAPVEGIGAPRYTSVARSKAAQAMLYLDIDLVPLEDNYDGSNQQPQHFLPLIPLVLLNGVSGIAVGWSTNILPHGLKTLIEATKQAVLGLPIKPFAPHYQRYNLHISPLGPNQWELQGKVSIVNTSTIQVTELPPGLSIENFRKRLIAMEDADQIVGYVDRSTETIDIMIKMKRGSVANWTEVQALDLFKLRERITERLVVLDWDGKSVRTYETPEELVIDFVRWRLGWYTKRFEKLRDDSKYELRYWTALRALFDVKFPKKLGTFNNRAGLQDDIMKTLSKCKIDIDQSQLDRIANLPTYRWTQEFAAEVGSRIDGLTTAIADHEATLGSPERLRQVYVDELDQLRTLKL